MSSASSLVKNSDSFSAAQFASKCSPLVEKLAASRSTNVPSIPGQFPDISRIDEQNLSVYCARLITIVKMVFKHVSPDYREHRLQLNSLDLLWFGYLGLHILFREMYSYTICAMEMMTRGVDGSSVHKLFQYSPGAPYVGVLDSQSEQNLSMLRVLSETIITFTSILSSNSRIRGQLKLRTADIAQNVFRGVLATVETSADDVSVLMEDSFSLLVEFGFLVAPAADVDTPNDVLNMVHLFWILEIVKNVCGVVEWCSNKHPSAMDPRISSLDEAGAFPEAREFLRWILSLLKLEDSLCDMIMASVSSTFLLKFCKATLLPYLRRSSILLYSRFSMVSPCISDKVHLTDSEESEPVDEMTRLLEYLHLPSLEEVFSSHTREHPILSKLIAGWCLHLSDLKRLRSMATESPEEPLVWIVSPSVLHLVSIPERFDILFEDSKREECRACGSLPTTPALCLLCGTFVCSQSFCCTVGDIGECNMHSRMYERALI